MDVSQSGKETGFVPALRLVGTLGFKIRVQVWGLPRDGGLLLTQQPGILAQDQSKLAPASYVYHQ